MTSPDEPTFETWAFVELYGHRQLSGRVTEPQVAGATMLRIDVPALQVPGVAGPVEEPAFTRLYGAGAIYSITPCSEEAARMAQRRIRPTPLPFYVPEMVPQISAGEEDWEANGEDF